MTCTPCDGLTPVVSVRTARLIVGRLAPLARTRLLVPTLEWLCASHPGVVMYQGITGRSYTEAERREIAFDQGALNSTPCPYKTKDGCMIGGARVRGTTSAPFGWLPTLVAREIDMATFSSLSRMRAIADAKIALLTRMSEFPLRPAKAPASSKKADSRQEQVKV